MEKNIRSSDGVTLLTLTITITIMVILAAITMTGVSKDNGITDKARNVQKNSERQINTAQNSISRINQEWENVLSQNKIENEINDR